MTVNIETRTIESPQATEIYISACPVKKQPVRQQWRDIFAAVMDILAEENAFILQERVFGTGQALKIAPNIRASVYGSIDDGVAPANLVCKESILGPVAGVQVHACSSARRAEKVNLHGTDCGRIIKINDRTILTLSSISANPSISAAEQAKEIMEKSESALAQFGADFFSVSRTWMWLKDILSWYGDFNNVRNQFFTQRGIIAPNGQLSLPASTGIGLAPVEGDCAMDLIAAISPPHSIQYLTGAGRQHCPFEYGSAFSRAAIALSPAGKTVFVSGTACIDAEGKTAHIGDASGQISQTIENVKAVLKEAHCKDNDVVSAMAYCKTPDVEKIFGEIKRKLSWPIITAVCDICRPDLLFELEATAKIP